MHMHACMHAVCTACTAQPVMTAALCAPERLPQKHQSPLRRQNKTHRNPPYKAYNKQSTAQKTQICPEKAHPDRTDPIDILRHAAL